MKNIEQGEWKVVDAKEKFVYAERNIKGAGNVICMMGNILNTSYIDNAQLIADAGNTYNKSNLLPSELLEQRNELVKELKYSKGILEELSTQFGWNKEKQNLVNVAIRKSESLISKIEK